jgi:hypothetical protein
MNWTPVTSFGPRAAHALRMPVLMKHPESTDLSPSYPEDSDLAEKDSSRESVRLLSCPWTPLSPFFSILAHHLRKDRRDAGAHSRRWKRAYSAQFWCNINPLAATLMDLPASVANKRLTSRLNPLDATFTKIRGVGVRISLASLHRYFLLSGHLFRRRPFGRKLSYALSE